MQPLDGNAMAGALYEAFGDEMTTRTGICEHCGATGLLAELRVYIRAPGIVARCPNCGNVVLVLVDARGTLRIHLAVELLRGDQTEAPGGPPPGPGRRW
jgi:ribosomal protein S27AE